MSLSETIMHAVKNGITVNFRPSSISPDALEIVTSHNSKQQGPMFSAVSISPSLLDEFNGSHEYLLRWHLNRLMSDIISVDLTDGGNPR